MIFMAWAFLSNFHEIPLASARGWIVIRVASADCTGDLSRSFRRSFEPGHWDVSVRDMRKFFSQGGARLALTGNGSMSHDAISRPMLVANIVPLHRRYRVARSARVSLVNCPSYGFEF